MVDGDEAIIFQGVPYLYRCRLFRAIHLVQQGLHTTSRHWVALEDGREGTVLQGVGEALFECFSCSEDCHELVSVK